ncbi:MAG: biotin-dependent carboxyltransferase family protein [Defluviitaleaceae bacterium]|nr:biotin-dependent carboxyltransferase family protein [Defluviitaleaceae bacterium]
MTAEIITPGILTIVVDSGRKGFRKLGIPSSGAMDSLAYKTANILVGNDENSAVLEFSLTAPSMRFLSDSVIAITGAEFSPEIDGNPVPMWESIFIKKGSVLSFGMLKSGCRGYLSFAGGIDVPVVMNSKTTFLRAGIGGYEGRALKVSDIITTSAPSKTLRELIGNRIKQVYSYTGEYTVRVVLGPQDDFFTNSGIETFLNSSYQVTNQFDRMGYRLNGPQIETKSGSDIISEGIVTGSIQIPGDGNPIIVMEDGQTAGGYAKIATVISSDLHIVAQSKTGDIIRFEGISIEEAHAILVQNTNSLVNAIEHHPKNRHNFLVKVNGKPYDIVVEEVF